MKQWPYSRWKWLKWWLLYMIHGKPIVAKSYHIDVEFTEEELGRLFRNEGSVDPPEGGYPE